MSDQELNEMESRFPAMSGVAFSSARERTLQSGHPVLQSCDDMIYEVFPDGRRRPIKSIPPSISTVSGTIFEIG